jgi:G3E family GTPase
MRQLLAHADGRRLAVIVDEFDELGIDRELLLGCGAEDIVELANGCLRDRCLVVQAVGSREEQRFDWPWTPAKSARCGSL